MSDMNLLPDRGENRKKKLLCQAYTSAFMQRLDL